MAHPTHYPNSRQELLPIDKLSVGCLKNQIAYIERTGLKIEYLSALKKEYSNKTKKTFKFIN